MSTPLHTFAILAYKENPYLCECIESLMRQAVRSAIICCTSTPNEHISSICEKFNISLFVNPVRRDTQTDANFAYEKAETPYVTLAHQDCVYDLNFTTKTLEYLGRAKQPLIAFTQGYDIVGERLIYENRVIKMRRLVLSPLLLKSFWSSRFIGRRILSVCYPLFAPSITFAKTNIGAEVLWQNHELKSSMDWYDAVIMRDLKGEFVYIPYRLVGDRKNEFSTTAATIAEGSRAKEDLQVFQMFWPRPIATLLCNMYVKGYEACNIEGSK